MSSQIARSHGPVAAALCVAQKMIGIEFELELESELDGDGDGRRRGENTKHTQLMLGFRAYRIFRIQ